MANEAEKGEGEEGKEEEQVGGKEATEGRRSVICFAAGDAAEDCFENGTFATGLEIILEIVAEAAVGTERAA